MMKLLEYTSDKEEKHTAYRRQRQKCMMGGMPTKQATTVITKNPGRAMRHPSAALRTQRETIEGKTSSSILIAASAGIQGILDTNLSQLL